MPKTDKEFYVTFGQKYRHQKHPFQEYPHPDGWLTVAASSDDEALRKTYTELGVFWAMIYAAGKFDRSYYPKGELKRI